MINIKELLINEQINEKEVQVIDETGANIGMMKTAEALAMAEEKELDLVLLANNGGNSVCKIMDYGKYRFEQMKKEKEAKKNQKIIDVKEIRVTPTIDTHDFEFKMKNASKFLKSGDKVKITVRFRGREVNNSSIGENVLNKFIEGLEEVSIVEKKPVLEGRNMFIILAPKQ